MKEKLPWKAGRQEREKGRKVERGKERERRRKGGKEEKEEADKWPRTRAVEKSH